MFTSKATGNTRRGSKKQAVLLREMVSEIDPKAFLILTDAQEIRGEGFLDYSREEL